MLRIQHSTQVPRPPGRVWAVFEDLPSWSKWNPVTPAVQWLTEGLWRRGARLRITFRLGGRRMLLEPELFALDPGRSVTWAGRRFGLSVRQSFAFEADEGGTRITVTQTLSGPMLFLYRILMPASRIRAMLVRWLEALKAEAER
jgi:hypothetical protein